MIKTSFYGNKELPKNNGITLFSVSLYTPNWFNLPYWHLNAHFKIAPTKSLLDGYKKGNISQLDYVDQYVYGILARVDRAELINYINNMSAGNDAVLLCWERPDEFCHRHLLRDFLGGTEELAYV